LRRPGKRHRADQACSLCSEREHGGGISGEVPFADFLEAPALLRGCGAVPAGSAAFQAFGDPGSVLLRVVVVVLELGGNARDVEPQAADSGKHPAIWGHVHTDLGMVASWLEVR
jgi:hypothetical protein